MEFTSLLFLKTKEKENELLHLGPWISISSHGRPLAEGTEQGRVSGAVFRRGVAPEVGEKLGKRERRSSRTRRRSRSWLGCSESAAPRRAAADGGLFRCGGAPVGEGEQWRGR